MDKILKKRYTKCKFCSYWPETISTNGKDKINNQMDVALIGQSRGYVTIIRKCLMLKMFVESDFYCACFEFSGRPQYFDVLGIKEKDLYEQPKQ